MNVIKTAIDGMVIIELRIFEGSRAYFFESFLSAEDTKHPILIDFDSPFDYKQ